MWLPLFAMLFAPAPILALFAGLWKLGHATRQRKMDKQGWLGLALTFLSLTGRWWLRLLRPTSNDEPKPLTPTHNGTARGCSGVWLRWEQFGPDDAPAILFSHGWSLTQETWYYQIKALAGEFRVIVWDMRGTGQSETPADSDYSLNAFLEDLAAVFDASEAGRHPQGCILAGHSLGAMLLPLFAERYPEQMRRVNGLALLSGTDTPLLETMRGRKWLMPLRPIFFEPFARLLAAFPFVFDPLARLLWQTGTLHAAIMYGLHRGCESRGQMDLVARVCGHFSMRAAGLGAITCFAFDARSAMPHITVPTLLLTGDCDVNMPPEIQRAMAARLRYPELALLENCGHVALLECHHEVSGRLADFARRCFQPR